MSRERYQKDCPGCRPAMIDPTTGKVYPEDSDIMKAMMRVWDSLEHWQKQAFHDFCCLNVHSNFNIAVMNEIMRRLKATEKENGARNAG